MSQFLGFPTGKVERVEVLAYTLGPGGHAQVVDVTLEVFLRNETASIVHEISFGDQGPALEAIRALVRTLNEQLSQQRGEGPANRV